MAILLFLTTIEYGLGNIIKAISEMAVQVGNRNRSNQVLRGKAAENKRSQAIWFSNLFLSSSKNEP
jgi:hypothetical protein